VSATGGYTHNQYEVSVSRPDGSGHTVTAIITPLNQLDATFSLRVPVIDVGGWMRLAAARGVEESARLRSEATRNDSDAEVARQYYGLVGATWLREATSKALAAAERNLDVLVQRRAAERALETDVLRARAEVERAKKTIAEAETQVRAAARGLHTLTGLEPTTGVPSFEPPRSEELPKGELRNLALNAPAVKAAEGDVVAAEKTRDAAWAAFAPTVSAAVNERVTNATGFAGRNGLFNLQVTASWTLDYTTLTQARASDSAAALAKVRAERAKQAQLDVVADAADRVEVQAVRARAAAAEEDAATHLVAHWRDRLSAGNATLLEVVQAERDALSATASRIQAEADLAYARQLLVAKTKGSAR
jgi:outer membrane protein TolC